MSGEAFGGAVAKINERTPVGHFDVVELEHLIDVDHVDIHVQHLHIDHLLLLEVTVCCLFCLLKGIEVNLRGLVGFHEVAQEEPNATLVDADGAEVVEGLVRLPKLGDPL